MQKMEALHIILLLLWRLLSGSLLGAVQECNLAYDLDRNAVDLKGIFRHVARAYFAPLTGAIKGCRKTFTSF